MSAVERLRHVSVMLLITALDVVTLCVLVCTVPFVWARRKLESTLTHQERAG